MSALRIHWCSPLDSGQQKASEKYDTGALDFAGIVDFAKEADELGIDSLLMGISYHMPDPLPMIGALVRETDRVKFILAYRPGLVPPTLFTQIVNTVSWMSDKRISLNLVAGISPDEQAYYGDFVAHDGRYERTGEFLDILNRFWSGESPLTYHGKHYRIEKPSSGCRSRTPSVRAFISAAPRTLPSRSPSSTAIAGCVTAIRRKELPRPPARFCSPVARWEFACTYSPAKPAPKRWPRSRA